MTAFAAAQHWMVVAALTDVASGLNENRGSHRLLDLAREHRVRLVVVEYRDRLARFVLDYLETFLHAFGVRVVVMESRGDRRSTRIRGGLDRLPGLGFNGP